MILILYDNKNRDFSTSIKLADAIISENKEVKICIANTFELDDALYLFKEIKVVLLPFLRIQFKNQILKLNKRKIKIAVYDTEGANGIDGLGVKQILKKSKNIIKYVDKYFFWGKAQAHSCKEFFQDKKKIQIVGYSRFVQSDKKIINQNKFLICSNFALTNPKYNKKKDEILILKKSGIYQNHLNKFYNSMAKREKSFYEIVDQILKNNPKKNFILRPHPYENVKNTIEITQKYKNCEMSLINNSNDIIKKSECLIHIDCITSLEARMLNVPSISLAWLVKEKNLCYKILYNSGYKSKSLVHLNYILKNWKNMKKYILKQNRKNKQFEKFFGNPKLNSVRLIAKSLISLNLSKRKHNIDFDEKFWIKIKIFSKLILPRKIFLILYSLIRPNLYNSYKDKTEEVKKDFLNIFLRKNRFRFKGNLIIIGKE